MRYMQVKHLEDTQYLLVFFCCFWTKTKDYTRFPPVFCIFGNEVMNTNLRSPRESFTYTMSYPACWSHSLQLTKYLLSVCLLKTAWDCGVYSWMTDDYWRLSSRSPSLTPVTKLYVSGRLIVQGSVCVWVCMHAHAWICMCMCAIMRTNIFRRWEISERWRNKRNLFIFLVGMGGTERRAKISSIQLFSLMGLSLAKDRSFWIAQIPS